MGHPDDAGGRETVARWSAVAAALVALGLLAVDAVHGVWCHDAGVYLMQAGLLAEGLRPYLDFQPFYPPLMQLIHAGPLRLGVDRLLLTVWLPVAWVAVIVGLGAGVLVCRGTPAWLAWLLASTYPLLCLDYEGNHVTLEHGVVAAGLLGVWLFGPPEVAGWRRYLLAGLACGLALLVKQVGLLLLLPYLAVARSPRHVGALAAGLAMPLLLLLGWLNFELGPVLESGALLARYAAQDSQGSLLLTLRHVWGALWFAPTLIEWELARSPAGVAFLGGSLLLALSLLMQQARLRRWQALMWVGGWLVVALTFHGLRFIRDYPHYTLNVWVTVVAVWAVALRGDVLRRPRRVLAGVAVATSAALALGALARPSYLWRWDTPSNLGAFIVPTAAELARLVPPNDPVVDNTDDQILLFLAHRRAANIDWKPPPIRPHDLDRFVPPGQPCWVLTHPEGDPMLYGRLRQALDRDPRYQFVWAWHSAYKDLVLYRRLPPP
ncbi:MAG: hypothetical protein VKQ33_02100 [Candidatus Sericytochromatia bacterium]|nr:hypothetical protein [Candidatus Sericytochromatia bacterium]